MTRPGRHYSGKTLSKSDEMRKGHGKKAKYGVCSTTSLVKKEEKDVQQLEQQAANQTGPQESAIFVKEYNLHDVAERKIYTDQTGRFPVTSYKGNQYIMVLFETVTNNILLEPMRSRVSEEMARAIKPWLTGCTKRT